MPEQLRNIIPLQTLNKMLDIKHVASINSQRKNALAGILGVDPNTVNLETLETLNQIRDARINDSYKVEGPSLRVATQKGFSKKWS